VEYRSTNTENPFLRRGRPAGPTITLSPRSGILSVQKPGQNLTAPVSGVVTTPFTFMATDNEEPASGTPEPAEAVDPSPSQNIPTMQDSGTGTRPSYVG
jgi:hypothetical protein